MTVLLCVELICDIKEKNLKVYFISLIISVTYCSQQGELDGEISISVAGSHLRGPTGSKLKVIFL